jgi:predicted dehydrogenase
MSNIKVAIIGAGYMATEHAKAFHGLPGVELAGVYSRTASRAESLAQQYPGMKVCNSIADLYEKTQANLVVVTVKELSMREVALACFDHPWVVLLEKPAGYSLPDAEKIHDAAVVAGSKVFVALNRRAYSSTRQALDLLNLRPEDQRFVTVLDQQDQIAARDIYHEPPEVVQNYMFANSIHLIDYFNAICRGDIVRVTPVLPWVPENPGVVVAKIEYSSGDVGLYEGNWMGPGPWVVTVATPSRRIEMKPLEQATEQLRGERRANPLPVDPMDSEFKPGLRYQAQQAVAAVAGRETFLPSLAESMRSMRLVSEIFEMR